MGSREVVVVDFAGKVAGWEGGEKVTAGSWDGRVTLNDYYVWYL